MNQSKQEQFNSETFCNITPILIPDKPITRHLGPISLGNLTARNKNYTNNGTISARRLADNSNPPKNK